MQPEQRSTGLCGGAVGARVGPASPGGPGASAKNGDIIPVPPEHQTTRSKKRSFLRAVERARRTGRAVYRGRVLQVGVPEIPVGGMHKDAACPRRGAARIGCLTWNCSGLTQELLAEILLWVKDMPHISILFLQETHWGFEGDWTKEGWHFCHSTTNKRQSGGVLVALRATHFEKSSVRWHAISPGRLLHIRCFAQKQHLDLICLYQHALPYKSDKMQDVMSKRNQIWKQVDHLIGEMPVRSSVILAGDFNCVLQPLPPGVGPGIHPGPVAKHLVAERQLVSEMLVRHDMCVLNSWGRRRYTYQHPKGRSQIDFIAARRSVVDSTARMATVANAPLAGWRSSGHLPVVATVRLDWRPWKHAAHKPSRLPLLSPPQQHHTLQQLKVHVSSFVHPPTPPQRPPERSLDGPVKTYWSCRVQLYKDRQRPASMQFLSVSARVHLHARMQAAHRELRKAAAARKRQQQLDILQLAEEAARTGNHKDLYRCVRWLAPNKRKQTIRLRTPQGQLMSPVQECAALAAHAAALFKGEPFEPPELLPLAPDLLSSERWQKALRCVNAQKAVPTAEPPGQAWKAAAATAADELARLSQSALCCCSPELPSEWTTVQLIWIPKPSKTPSCPGNLRSLGLMPVDAKAFLLVLRSSAERYILDSLRETPQYAYRPKVGTDNALLRATHHCAAVRSLVGRCKNDHTAKVLDQGVSLLKGGLMCNLDLAKAFDTVPHNELYASMQDAGIPEALSRIILHVHTRTTCIIDHGGVRRAVGMGRGLRQGCPISPVIYTCFTARLCRMLDQRLGRGWCQAHLSVFADDTHGFWQLHTPADFHRARRELYTVISTLHTLGMSINTTKSIAVVIMRGKAAPMLYKRYFRAKHGSQNLRLQSSDACDIYLPCAESMEYLGGILSYDNFEGRTARHRAQKADSIFKQLSKVLRTNGALESCHRLRIYKALVVSSLFYGVACTGVTPEVVRRVTSLLSQHLRKVLRIYEHGRTNVDVLKQAGIDPVALLERHIQRLHDSIALDGNRSEALKHVEYTRSAAILAQVAAARDNPDSSALLYLGKDSVCAVDCPVCGVAYGTREGLAMHMHHRHPEIRRNSQLPFSRAAHSLHGVPVCRFCRFRAHDWSSLRKQAGQCAWVQNAIVDGTAKEDLLQRIEMQERVQRPCPPDDALSNDALQAARTCVASGDFAPALAGSQLQCLARQCLLCAQRMRTAARIKPHWQIQHPVAWRLSHRSASTESSSLVALFHRPCKFCGSQAKNTREHAAQCPALFQALALRALKRRGYTLEQAASDTFCENEQRHEPKQGSLMDLWKPAERITPAKSTPAVKDPQSQAVVSDGASPPPDLAASLGTSWLLRVVLRNPSNHCYANAGVLALLHTLEHQAALPSALRPLRRALQQAAAMHQSVTLSSLLVMRSLVPRWPFDRTQQDTLEFLAPLLRKAQVDAGVWEARCIEAGAIYRHAFGVAPIEIQPVGKVCTLQEAVRGWHQHAFPHALTTASHRVLLFINRYATAGKSFCEVRFQDEVQLPVFRHGTEVQWHRYRPCAAVLHFGATPHMGHYRSLLRVETHWFFTQDGQLPTPQIIKRQHCTNVYAIWLQRTLEANGPAPADPPQC